MTISSTEVTWLKKILKKPLLNKEEEVNKIQSIKHFHQDIIKNCIIVQDSILLLEEINQESNIVDKKEFKNIISLINEEIKKIQTSDYEKVEDVKEVDYIYAILESTKLLKNLEINKLAKNLIAYNKLNEEERNAFANENNLSRELLDEIAKNVNSSILNFNIEKNDFIERNMRLVVNIAKTYHRKGNYSFSLLDAVQEGCLGLVSAILKFEPSKGLSFSTYASFWIKFVINEFLRNSDFSKIKIPKHKEDLYKKIFKSKNELALTLEREPTIQEIAERTELDEDVIKKFSSNYEKIFLMSEINNFNSNEQFMIPDSAPTSTDSWHINNIPHNDIECSPFEKLSLDKMEIDITKELDKHLNERNSYIMKKRYGLIDNKTYTMEEIGEELKLSKERIRIIEKTALDILSKKSNYLMEYLTRC